MKTDTGCKTTNNRAKSVYVLLGKYAYDIYLVVDMTHSVRKWLRLQGYVLLHVGLTLMLLQDNVADKNDAKHLKNDWNPGTWVFIWENSAGAAHNEYQHDTV